MCNQVGYVGSSTIRATTPREAKLRSVGWALDQEDYTEVKLVRSVGWVLEQEDYTLATKVNSASRGLHRLLEASSPPVPLHSVG